MKKILAVVSIILFFNPCLLCAESRNLSTCSNTDISRFIINDGNVFDKLTKLTWKRCSAGSIWKSDLGCVGAAQLMSFDNACDFANKVGGGWRMPTIDELNSIVDHQHKNPAINTNIFPDMNISDFSLSYWSTTRVQGLPKLIYYINFMGGRVDAHSSGFMMRVRFVRDHFDKKEK